MASRVTTCSVGCIYLSRCVMSVTQDKHCSKTDSDTALSYTYGSFVLPYYTPYLTLKHSTVTCTCVKRLKSCSFTFLVLQIDQIWYPLAWLYSVISSHYLVFRQSAQVSAARSPAVTAKTLSTEDEIFLVNTSRRNPTSPPMQTCFKLMLEFPSQINRGRPSISFNVFCHSFSPPYLYEAYMQYTVQISFMSVTSLYIISRRIPTYAMTSPGHWKNVYMYFNRWKAEIFFLDVLI